MISNELLNQLQELTQSTNLLPSVESAIHNLMLSAYQEGYSDGYEDVNYPTVEVATRQEIEEKF